MGMKFLSKKKGKKRHKSSQKTKGKRTPQEDAADERQAKGKQASKLLTRCEAVSDNSNKNNKNNRQLAKNYKAKGRHAAPDPTPTPTPSPSWGPGGVKLPAACLATQQKRPRNREEKRLAVQREKLA